MPLVFPRHGDLRCANVHSGRPGAAAVASGQSVGSTEKARDGQAARTVGACNAVCSKCLRSDPCLPLVQTQLAHLQLAQGAQTEVGPNGRLQMIDIWFVACSAATTSVDVGRHA